MIAIVEWYKIMNDNCVILLFCFYIVYVIAIVFVNVGVCISEYN